MNIFWWDRYRWKDLCLSFTTRLIRSKTGTWRKCYGRWKIEDFRKNAKNNLLRWAQRVKAPVCCASALGGQSGTLPPQLNVIQKSCLERPARSTWIGMTRWIPKYLSWRFLDLGLRSEGVSRNGGCHNDLAGFHEGPPHGWSKSKNHTKSDGWFVLVWGIPVDCVSRSGSDFLNLYGFLARKI